MIVSSLISFACEPLCGLPCWCGSDKCRSYYRWPIKAAACNEATETEIMVMVNWGEG